MKTQPKNIKPKEKLVYKIGYTQHLERAQRIPFRDLAHTVATTIFLLLNQINDCALIRCVAETHTSAQYT